ncbi:hypothetical protein [Hymenobacter glaciei]|uniref:hypothetical protein n=1 Tax=Hymenobacter glaciei TaxID=877209 RepID=UPI0031E5EE7C
MLHFRLLAVLMVFAGLASGCQSSRPSFSFQPIVLRATAPASPTMAGRAATVEMPAAPLAATTTLAPAAPVAEVVGMPLPAGPAAKSQVPAAARQQFAQPQLLAAATAQTATTPPAKVRASLFRQRPLLHRAHAPASQGLGLTVLGILGMVVLVVALVGLAISGGGVGWIITAAIAAGVVLLAYLDPGGH